MPLKLSNEIENIFGEVPYLITKISGGSIAEVFHIHTNDKSEVIAKLDQIGESLLNEGWMLEFLKEKSNLPIPNVLHCSKELLVLEYIPTQGGINRNAEEDAADHLAKLHNIKNSKFGLEKNTFIGGLSQPNPYYHKWLDFFKEQRLFYMSNKAVNAGKISIPIMNKIEKLCDSLDKFINEPDSPRLIHGDIWSGNVLCKNGKVNSFIDPAIYFANPEIELAFSTLFGTFSDHFFSRYNEYYPIEPEFFEVRRDIYNLYPILVHINLFGGSYVNSLSNILKRFLG